MAEEVREIDTGDPYTPVRWWIYEQLRELFPNNGTVINSVTTPRKFTEWTGWTQAGLQAQWEAEKGTGAVTTTCNAFLNQLVNKIALAGGLAPPKVFRSMDLPSERGWHVWTLDTNDRPQSGDFFRLTRLHVGVVFDIVGDKWTTVEAGQGGPTSKSDSIKRKGPRPFPSDPLLGWINIEEYFAGWGGS